MTIILKKYTKEISSFSFAASIVFVVSLLIFSCDSNLQKKHEVIYKVTSTTSKLNVIYLDENNEWVNESINSNKFIKTIAVNNNDVFHGKIAAECYTERNGVIRGSIYYNDKEVVSNQKESKYLMECEAWIDTYNDKTAEID